MASNCTYGSYPCRICGYVVTSNGFAHASHMAKHEREGLIRRLKNAYGGKSASVYNRLPGFWDKVEELYPGRQDRLQLSAAGRWFDIENVRNRTKPKRGEEPAT